MMNARLLTIDDEDLFYIQNEKHRKSSSACPKEAARSVDAPDKQESERKIVHTRWFGSCFALFSGRFAYLTKLFGLSKLQEAASTRKPIRFKRFTLKDSL